MSSFFIILVAVLSFRFLGSIQDPVSFFITIFSKFVSQFKNSIVVIEEEFWTTDTATRRHWSQELVRGGDRMRERVEKRNKNVKMLRRKKK